jgi:cell division protein ZapA (FtsZ GTPase activity inhibitor)
MAHNSVTIYVDNKEYQLRADIPVEVLDKAVDLVNDRITKFKNRSNRDELRATVMTAVSLAIEMSSDSEETIEQKAYVEELEAELSLAKEEISRITETISDSLKKIEDTLVEEPSQK